MGQKYAVINIPASDLQENVQLDLEAVQIQPGWLTIQRQRRREVFLHRCGTSLQEHIQKVSVQSDMFFQLR